MGLVKGTWRSFSESDGFPKKPGIKTQALARLGMVRRYWLSYFQSQKERALFEKTRTYCMFVGHARSGGTLVGSLLDAHPNVILADEVDVLKYVAAGFTRSQIFHLLLERSRFQANRGKTKPGRDAQNYSYQVPGQWQGRFDELVVIGDRKAGMSTQRLGRDPNLLGELKSVMGDLQIKLVNTVRNPFDTMSTMHLRSGRPLANAVELYFSNCATLRRLQEQMPAADNYLVRHEELLNNPTGTLQQLCELLSIPAEPGYIESCASILYKAPAKSRQKVEWSPQMIQDVMGRIGEYDFLQGYSFEDEGVNDGNSE